MTIDVGTASLLVAIVAACIAIWQGTMARRNLKLAEETQAKAQDAMTRTHQKVEDGLKDVRDISQETRMRVEDIKSEIDARITRILDARLEQDRNSQAAGNEFMKLLFGGMNPSPGIPQSPNPDDPDGPPRMGAA